jgi:arsenite methyltransferase
MADPFQDVDAAGPEFIKMFADAMDTRQNDPTMEQIVADYLAKIDCAPDSRIIEVGAGAGAVTRRIAAHAAPAPVIGFDPSSGFIQEARNRGAAYANLTFQVADGASLPLEDDTVDAVIMHTVLTHVTDPNILIEEAKRILKPGGVLIVSDSDFSKGTFSTFPNDPLDMCAREFCSSFVTDPFLVGKIRTLLTESGLSVSHFEVRSRVVTTPDQMLPWVEVTTKLMVERVDIGQELADALVAEHNRRADAGTLYGYQAFATVVATKPS